jgi:hypothetical protein
LAATTVGTPITAQGLDQRFTPAAAVCLRAVLHAAVGQVLGGDPAALPVLQRFRGVYLLDGTTITLPACLADLWRGCGGGTPNSGLAALKVQVRWELISGALDGLALQAGRDADSRTPLNGSPLPPGSLRLADLGYFDLDTLQDYDRHGCYWLTRLKWGTALFVAGQRVRALVAWLEQQQSDRIEQCVQVGSRQRLRCRLLAVRVPAAVAQQRQQRLRQAARDKGAKLSLARLACCAWNVWITNAPPEQLRLRDAEVFARVRWQIELLFKLWKSHGEIDQSRSGKPWRVLCEVYAKLVAMVVQHWVVLVSWGRGAGRSLRKAARKVRQHALHLASVLAVQERVQEVLTLLQRCLQRGPQINRRKKKPATFQLLLALPEEDVQDEEAQEPPLAA